MEAPEGERGRRREIGGTGLAYRWVLKSKSSPRVRMMPVSLELQRPWQITQREEEAGSWVREGGRKGEREGRRRV